MSDSSKRASRNRLSSRVETLEDRRLLAALVGSDFVIDGSMDNYSDGGLLTAKNAVYWSSGSPASLGQASSNEVFHGRLAGSFNVNEPIRYSSLDVSVEPGQSYRIEGMAVEVIDQQRLKLFQYPLDSAGNSIRPMHTSAWNQSIDTELLAPISPGDTSIELSDASTWSHSPDGSPRSRALAIFHSTEHPDTIVVDPASGIGRYTPNVALNYLHGLWQPLGLQPNPVTGGHTLTLTEPWQGDPVPVGTIVRNADATNDFFELDHQLIDGPAVFPGQVGPRRADAMSPFVAELSDGMNTPPVGTTTDSTTWPPGTSSFKIASNLPFSGLKIFHASNDIGPQSFEGSTRAALTRSEQTLVGDKSVRVATDQDHYLSVRAKSESATDTHSAGYQAIDADGLAIQSHHVTKHDGATDTTLAQPLQPGDGVIVLSDASGWSQSTDPESRAIAWYGYTDATGDTHEDYSYTRNVATDPINGLWSPTGIAGNIITLNQPWSGPEIVAGTAIRNATGGTETFQSALMNSIPLDDEFRVFDSESISGTWTGGQPDPRSFPPGTESIRAMIRANTTNFDSDDAVVIESFYFLQSLPQRIYPDAAGQYSLLIDLDHLPGFDPTLPPDYTVAQPRYGTVTMVSPTVARYTAPSEFVGSDLFLVSSTTQWNRNSRVTLTIRGGNVESQGGVESSFIPRTVAESLAEPSMASDSFAGDYDYTLAFQQTLVADGISSPSLVDVNRESIESIPLPDRSHLTFTLLEGPKNGSLDFRSDGTFTYRPFWRLTDSFRYVIYDGVRSETGIIRINSRVTSLDLPGRRLKKIHAAMFQQHLRFQQFPVTDGNGSVNYRDADGNPYLSWRVHLLPELGYEALYQQFQLDEPWDSAHNLPLSMRMPAVFDSGEASQTNQTRLQTITTHFDPANPSPFQAGFDDNRSTGAADIVDGLSPSDPNFRDAFDANGDGSVDLQDFSVFRGSFGTAR